MPQHLKDEFSSLSKIAAPAVLAQLAHMSMGVIDTIMAGHLGAEALASVATGVNLFAPPMLFILGVFLALNPICAQHNGAKRYQNISLTVQNALWFAAIISIPVFLLWRHLYVVMDWLGVQPAIKPLARDYLDALSWGTPFYWGFLALRFCNEGLFANRAVMWCYFSAIPLNIFFNYSFIYGKFGFPELGAVGVGYATSCVWLFLFAVLLVYTINAKRHRHLHLFAQFHRPQWPLFKELLSIGTPMGLAFGMEVLMFCMMGLMMATYDTTTAAAHQVALNFASMSFMVPLGIADAITARVGFAIGEGSPKGVQHAGQTGILLAVCCMSVSATIMIFFPGVVTSIYTEDIGVQTIAISFLFLAGIFQFSDGLQVSASGALRGMKDTRFPMLISLTAYWIIGFPAGWLFAHYTSLGAAGYWAGMICGLSTAAVLLNWRFYVLSHSWHPTRC